MYGLSGADGSLAGLRRGGYLDRVDLFDPPFFGISPREAEAMDPQQRLVLELSWEALEDAGVLPASLRGSRAGVYVGAMSSEYADLLDRGDAQMLTRHAFTGTQRGIIANRVSYSLGFRGPSLTVDTGQSSGLVAVYLACESLLSGESSFALAGGVNLNLGGHNAVALARLGALSPEGRCFVFDARANGFVRGEGGGVVALKTLERALVDGDSIYCVIRGGAVNNDGGGEGLTAPDQRAQEELLQVAYERAGVEPWQTQYVELHGTGTPLGDKVEAGALGAVLGAVRPTDDPLWVGSAKTNVGHLEGAAGVVGLIKAALSIRHGEIPASLNFAEPSPEIPLGALRLRVQQALGEWPAVEQPRLAGVSSFGIGGTNCHLVLEQAPEAEQPDPNGSPDGVPSVGVVPWVLSSRTASGLAAQAHRLVSHLESRPDLRVGDVGFSLAKFRSAFEHRAVVLGDGRGRLLEGLEALAGGVSAGNLVQGVADRHGGGRGVVFVFPGQGSQWIGMGLELMERSPVFVASMRDCAEALLPYCDFSLEGVLRGDPEQPGLTRVDVVQPTLFAVMVSLARLWESVGVRPEAVVGHSQGEIAAAHIAGGLSLGDAARVVALRSRALASLAGQGGMVSVALPADQLGERLGALGGRVGIAAVNGPASVVVSGDLEALGELLERCEADGIRARTIPVDYASHSPHVEAVRERVLQALGPIAPCDGDVPLYSTVTGERLEISSMDAEYWYRGLRQTVQFELVIRELARDGDRAFVEVSPHPVLTVGVQETIDDECPDPAGVAVLGTLRRDDGGAERFMSAFAALHAHGARIDWQALFRGSGARRIDLPTYAFERRRYWLGMDTASGVDRVPLDVSVSESEPAEALPEQGRSAGSLAARLAGLPEPERAQIVLDLVLAQVAFVLGHVSGEDLDPRQAFKELGFDSAAGVELRNRVRAATGLKLPAAVVFDHPTPLAVRDLLLGELTGVSGERGPEPSRISTDEPLAIVGMACRFPGGVRSPEEFWRLLESGGDAVGEFPTDRGWDVERLFDPDPDHPGTTYTRHGGFLYDAADFDAEHFSISPREALAMDPQQRLLLEGVWEALEDAGIDPLTLRGSQTGVFVGAMSQDYGSRLHEAGQCQGYALTGNTVSVASGRIAYAFGLEGPAVSVDTACSASLVALHLAAQAVRQGECSLALVGGVTVMANPGMFVEFSRQRGLSPDGRCRAFGAGANGTSWSEGVAVLAVERLSEAQRRGHRVLALVRGSAVNQDGASNGLTAPNGPSQERVIRRALASAGLAPADVDVVEAHGTGTMLGDPIEAQALLATYGRERASGPLWLGSVKSNIGHTQAAAGLAGVIKMVLAMRHGVVPRTLYAEEPSPHVDWESGEVELLSEAVEWPAGGERARRAGVSSFGISGTNAHVILEEAPMERPVQAHEGGEAAPAFEGGEAAPAFEAGDAAPAFEGGDAAPAFEGGGLPLLVSGSSAEALRAQAERLRSFVAQRPEVELDAVAAGLAFGRASLSHRAVALASGRDGLLETLAALERGELVDELVEGVARRDGGVALIFPGQGSQWERMGWALWQSSPVFAEGMEACSEALARYVDWSLEDVLRGAPGAPSLDRVGVVQPALFAVMVSLAGLWRSFGVRPVAVVGHSQGEIAAAYVAGALSLDDAARVVALRSKLVGEELSGRGGMVSIAQSAGQVSARLERFEGRVSLAAINGPSAVVVSGENEALDRLLAECEADGVRARRIPVDYAAHSVQIEGLRERMLGELSSLTPRVPEISFYSTVTGELLDGVELDGEYWYRNLRQTVQFEPAIRALAHAATTLIETSPHPVLTVAAEETIEASGRDPATYAVIGSLRRDDGEPKRFLASLAQAHTHGVKIEWDRLLDRRSAADVSLPTYPFRRQRYWLASRTATGDASSLGLSGDQHPFLGAHVALADGEGAIFTGRISLQTHPWLADHAVLGTVLLPGTGFLELALHAAARLGCDVVQELTMAAPLTFDERRAAQLQVIVSAPDEHGHRQLTVHSRPEPEPADESTAWIVHATGVLASEPSGSIADTRGLREDAWPPVGAEELEGDDLYDRLAAAGYEYGPAFQVLRRAYRQVGGLFAEAAVSDDQATAAGTFALHPALCDGAVQAAVLDGLESQRTVVPFAFSGVRVYREGPSSLRVRVIEGERGPAIVGVDESGAPVVSIESVQLRPIDGRRLSSAGQPASDGLFELRWVEVPATAGEAPAAEIAIVDAGGTARERLEAPVYEDLGALERAVAGGAPVPNLVLAEATAPSEGPLPTRVGAVTERTLALMHDWLASQQLADSRLVVITERAVAVRGDVPDLVLAGLPGLVRSAHSEHPDRFALVDVDGDEASHAAFVRALLCGEPEVAVRGGALFVPRVARFTAGDAFALPADTPAWRLAVESPGTLESLQLTGSPSALAPLGAGQVRVSVRAAGLNFKDVVVALGLVADPEVSVGIEGAGVVLEVAPDVTDLAPGDRVLGLVADAFGPVAVAEAARLVRVPDGWSFVQAASVPVVFLTAWYGLVDLAGLCAGERVLIHSAAGGVGMAAVQVAGHLGAEVFATAHPDKWETLRGMGLDDAHIASSRDVEFTQQFLAATDGRGVDVVLGSLAGEMVDASLGVLAPGGRYVEMGKTDIREPERVAAAYPGVSYQSFDLLRTDSGRIGEMLREIVGLFERGVLERLPVRVFDVRRGREAFRLLRESRHTGKVVLRVPQPLDPDGTVLITGGTGGLGALQARRLVEAHGVRHLLLVSRRGPQADGAAEVVAELTERGCQVEVAACDVSDRAQLAGVIERIPAGRPLTAVIHAAGVLDDGVISALDGERLRRVMAPKLDAAVHLHELTEDLDLSEFVLYSSAAAALGSPGQGNYAAANAFLDALAHVRRASGLPATALAFGVWATATGMTGHLAQSGRGAGGAMDWVPLGDEEGLELIDLARAVDEPNVLPMRLDLRALRARARDNALPAIFSDLVRVPASQRAGAAAGSSLARLLAEAPEGERDAVALGVVRTHVAAVLGSSPEAVGRDRPFKELGFDSLSSVELRNRLGAATGLKLPATLVFDHPTPAAVAKLLRELVAGSERPTKAVARRSAAADDPLVIVGIACRYPGGANSPQEFWRLLEAGGDAIGEFPSDRGWDVERLYDPDPDRPGTTYTRRGGFLYDAADFDAEHFSISPREALAMDPQQRLLLETAWEAFEDAGIDPLTLKGSQTGVFTGAFSSEYGAGSVSPDGLEGFRLTGGHTSVISGRVAYSFGLEGPAVSVDTACSSSLVALHLAAQALRDGECSLALVGGVTVLATPSLFIEFSRQRGLSPDGRCRAFGAGADGTGFSDGVGMILVERLSDARRNSHNVLAVVRGSAVNQDGASNGLTAPNGPSQERVIRQALAAAGVAPADVDVVEAHGTGTTLGDPIEAGALLATYGQDRSRGPLYVGSVKSNIGHTQAAAGVAGVIKMVLAMRHGVVPRTLWAEEPSPHVDWESGEIAVLTEPVQWPAEGGRPRRAGVSSFGISGTNAHVILEEAPPEPEPEVAEPDGVGPVAWLVSARSDDALAAQAERLLEFVGGRPDVALKDVAFSLASGRARLHSRCAVIGTGREELLGRLGLLARGVSAPGVIRGSADGGRSAFLFTGQGAQRAGMGRGLYDAFGVFAQTFDSVCSKLDPLLERPLGDVVFAAEDSPEADLLDRTEFTQPALFALEVALFRLVESLGVKADFLIGHSVGEIAAAHVAGVFSLEDACRLVAARGRLMGALPEGGAMLAVEVPESIAVAAISGLEGRVSVAGVNAPGSVVLSGDADAVEALETRFRERDARVKRLRVSHAFHSPRMEPMLEEFAAVMSELSFSPPRMPIVSNLTGEALTAEQAQSPGYWVRHVRDAVRFADGIATLESAGVTHFLELGPDGVLSAMAARSLTPEAQERAVAVPALRPKVSEPESLLSFLAQADCAGVTVDWTRLYPGPHRIPLPGYAFQHRRYWLASRGNGGDPAALGLARDEHPLLGAMVRLGDGDAALFTGRISLQTHPWLTDYVVGEVVVFPATAFLELTLHAAAQLGAPVIEELTLAEPLALDSERGVHLQVMVAAPDGEGRREVGVFSRLETADDGSPAWVRRASGVAGLSREVAEETPHLAGPGGEWPPAGARELGGEFVYDDLAQAGHEYGPAFQVLRAAFRAGDEIYADVALDDERSSSAGFQLHPALTQGPLQALALARDSSSSNGLEVPSLFTGVRLYRDGPAAVRVSLKRGQHGTAIEAIDDSGAPVFSIDSVQMQTVDEAQLRAGVAAGSDGLYALRWTELTPQATEPQATEPQAAELAVLGEGEGLSDIDAPGYRDLSALEAAVAEGMSTPEQVVLDLGSASGEGLIDAVHELSERALELLQGWLATEWLPDARLVLVTHGAVAVLDGEVPNLSQAALPGLLRTARSEHPDRLALVDVDDSEESHSALLAALMSGEPEVAVRGGSLYVPRVTRFDPGQASPSSHGQLDPAGTVLVTGGTGGLGMLEARQLVQKHRVRHLLLVSRRGLDADGAAGLVSELGVLGCEVEVAACDVSDRDQLARLIGRIPDDRPLTAVVHAAGVLDDGVVTSLDGERLRRVMAPKLDAAIHLHELTEGLGLSEFILYSSAAAALGAPGQGNYAAANSFLDAFARWRRAKGLPAISLAFGMWGNAGMGGRLSERANASGAPIDLLPLEDEQGLELIDVARAADEALLLPMRLDMAALRARARAGLLPAILNGLVRVPAGQRAGAASSLARMLAAAPEAERDEIAFGVVRTHAAAVLGHAPEAIDKDRPFKDLGFDSLSAIQLRNQLAAITGVKLPATLVFDHPSPVAVARLLRGLVEGGQRGVREPVRGVARVDEPLAIVGMACRYPGGASSPEEFWRLLESGRDAIGEFPVDRGWDVERLYDPDPDHPGTTYTRQGGFLYDAAGFDAEHFSIAPREALAMDPQQRLLLETAWEALEHAGIDPLSLRGSETGTFVGVSAQEYGSRVYESGEPSDGYTLTGTTPSVASGRVAYALGLEGPAVSVDTACSSSLVALHLAGQALRQGECSLALVGGAMVLATPSHFIEFSRQRALSPDGRCRAFGAGANGTGWGEGVGLLALERLSDARRNGHPVLGVLRGSAVNQDGASNGLTAPNGPSQERVIRRALAGAGLAPADVDVVEAHGTGTTLGDPIEAGALLATYGQGRSGGPLYLGSVKSNIGHTQAAAGVAGVIKMVLAMRHGLLPKTLYAEEPSPHVDWEAGAIRLLTEPVEWPAGERPRRAGVSSFGVSGTNAHVILEEAPPVEPVSDAENQEPVVDLGGPVPVLVSGSSEGSLSGQAARLRAFVQRRPDLDLDAFASGVAFGRARLPHRAVALAGDREQLDALLSALERGETAEGLVEGVARSESRVAFVFPGQGSQWPGMGWELWQSSRVFAAEMEACAKALSRYVDWSLEDVLRGAPGAPSLDRVDVVQPALFAVLVSLAGLWRSLGVEPAAVVGHSQGEIAAAYVAGALSLDDAAQVVALRSLVVREELSGRGGMLSVAQGAEQVSARLAPLEGRVSLAAVNSPRSVVLSGEVEGLERLLAQCEADDVRAKLIPVDYAAHSHQIEAIRERMLRELATLSPRAPVVPFYSTVTGALLDSTPLDAEYWYRNLRETVQFDRAIRAVAERATTLIEASPHPVLTVAVEQTVESSSQVSGPVTVLGSLRRDDGGPARFAISLAEAYVNGARVDWGGLLDHRRARSEDLPTYAFQHRPYWLTPRPVAADAGALGLSVDDHPLLGAMVGLPDA